MSHSQKQLWQRVMQEWDDGNVACHLHFARLYTDNYPDNDFGWIALAEVLSMMARFPEAAVALDKAESVSSKETLYFVFRQRGHLSSEIGELQLAEEWYRKTIEFQETTENWIHLGACLARQTRFREAIAAYEKAIEIGSDTTTEAYYNLGLIYRAEENYGKALLHFEKAVELDSNYELAENAILDITRLTGLS